MLQDPRPTACSKFRFEGIARVEVVEGRFLVGEVRAPLHPCSLPAVTRLAVPETSLDVVVPGSVNLPFIFVSEYTHLLGIVVV